MIEETVIIKHKNGLHARPAGLLVKEASKFKSEITLIKNEKEFNAKSIMGVMTMAAVYGEEIIVRANGEDEVDALKEIVDILTNALE